MAIHAEFAAIEGKTIKAIRDGAVNVLEIDFTDGTSIGLEVESMGMGLYGIAKYEPNMGTEPLNPNDPRGN